MVANPLDVNRYLMEFYGVTHAVRRAKDAKDARAEDPTSKILNFEQLLELGKAGEIGADDQHIVRIVDWLLQYAYDQRASDIHLEPRREMSARALPHRRRAAQGVRVADPGDGRGDRADQDPRAHGHRRAAPPAGWAHQDAHPGRARGRDAPVHHADRVRRKSA